MNSLEAKVYEFESLKQGQIEPGIVVIGFNHPRQVNRLVSRFADTIRGQVPFSEAGEVRDIIRRARKDKFNGRLVLVCLLGDEVLGNGIYAEIMRPEYDQEIVPETPVRGMLTSAEFYTTGSDKPAGQLMIGSTIARFQNRPDAFLVSHGQLKSDSSLAGLFGIVNASEATARRVQSEALRVPASAGLPSLNRRRR